MIVFILKYWREIAVGVLICLLIAAVVYVKHVFTERNRLQTENSLLKKDLESAEKMQQLTNQITEAISQIKIRSTVNVSKIEQEQKPVFVGNNHPVVLVPGGLLPPVYSAYSARGTSPGNATGGSVAAVKPVL